MRTNLQPVNTNTETTVCDASRPIGKSNAGIREAHAGVLNEGAVRPSGLYLRDKAGWLSGNREYHFTDQLRRNPLDFLANLGRVFDCWFVYRFALLVSFYAFVSSKSLISRPSLLPPKSPIAFALRLAVQPLL